MILIGTVTFMVGTALVLLGVAFPSKGIKEMGCGGRQEADEERVVRRAEMMQKIRDMTKELEEVNEELRRYRSLMGRAGKEGYYYRLKGMSKGEQAEAMAAELERTMEKCSNEFGWEDVEV